MDTTNFPTAMLAALQECERRLARIACGELAGVTAKSSAKNGLETVRTAIAAATLSRPANTTPGQ